MIRIRIENCHRVKSRPLGGFDVVIDYEGPHYNPVTPLRVNGFLYRHGRIYPPGNTFRTGRFYLAVFNEAVASAIVDAFLAVVDKEFPELGPVDKRQYLMLSLMGKTGEER